MEFANQPVHPVYGHYPTNLPQQMDMNGEDNPANFYWDPYYSGPHWQPHDGHDVHDFVHVADLTHPMIGELDHRLIDADHHGWGHEYQHDDEHFGMDIERRHTFPVAHEVTDMFHDDGQHDFLAHGHVDGLVEQNLQENMSDDFEDNSVTYEDYFNHMAGFDEDVHVPNKWVETGNFH